MRLQKYIMNEMSLPNWANNIFDKAKEEFKKLSSEEFKAKCKKSFEEITRNKRIDKDDWRMFFEVIGGLGIHIPEETVKKLTEEIVYNEVINEDIKHWWDMVKSEAFPTLAFWPGLQVWLELDKLIKGTSYNGKVIGVYAAMWLLLISGKYLVSWMDWKKKNPEEYKQEHGK